MDRCYRTHRSSNVLHLESVQRPYHKNHNWSAILLPETTLLNLRSSLILSCSDNHHTLSIYLCSENRRTKYIHLCNRYTICLCVPYNSDQVTKYPFSRLISIWLFYKLAITFNVTRNKVRIAFHFAVCLAMAAPFKLLNSKWSLCIYKNCPDKR